MTETKTAAVETAEKKEVTVSWHKMTDGIGLVFAGVLSMLEALDAGTARDIMNFVSQGGAMKKEGEANDAEDTGAGAVDGDAGADDVVVVASFVCVLVFSFVLGVSAALDVSFFLSDRSEEDIYPSFPLTLTLLHPLSSL